MKFLSTLSLACFILNCQGDELPPLMRIPECCVTSATYLAKPPTTDLGNHLLSQLLTPGKLSLSQALENLLNGPTSVLTQPATSMTKRDLSLPDQFPSLQHEAEQAIVQRLGNMQGTFQEAKSKMEQSFAKLYHVPVDQIVAEIQHIDQTYKGLSQLWMKDLTDQLVEIFHKVVPNQHKRRGLADALSSVSSLLTDFFQPHVNALSQLVHIVGQSLTSSALTFSNAIQNSTFTQALHGSTHSILNHDHNALYALQKALANIVAKTTSNSAPHIVNIVHHGAGALGEGVDTLTSNVLKLPA